MGVDQLAVAGLPQFAGVADDGAAAAAGREGPEVSGRRGNDLKHLGQDPLDGLVVPGPLEALRGGAAGAAGVGQREVPGFFFPLIMKL